MSPTTVDYWLSPLGESLLEPMAKLVIWANQHFDEVAQHRRHFDAVARTARDKGQQPQAK